MSVNPIQMIAGVARWALQAAGGHGARYGRLLSAACCVIALAGMAPSAFAAVICTGGNRAMLIQVPAGITVPRDATAGTKLTGWILSSADSDLFNCTGVAITQNVGTRVDSMLTSPTGLTILESGEIHKVFETSLPGIGIAIGYRVYANGCGWPAAWSPLGVSGSRMCNSPIYTTNGVQIRVMFVKTGPVASGFVSAMPVANVSPYINGVPDTSQTVPYSIGSVRIDALSCSTPSVNVPLGAHSASEFKGRGSPTRTIPFKIALTGCPGQTEEAAISRITYQIDAVTTILDAEQSVVALGASATARGIGIQLLDKAGNPFRLGTATPLAGYAGAAGDYSIDLSARYLQTDAAVMPGTAEGAMTFTLNYL